MNTSVIATGLDSLCSQMPYMPGCTVRGICSNNSDVASQPWCNGVSLLADICVEDMPMMSGCANYNRLCSNVSVVAECKTRTMLPQLPTTKQAYQLVQDICASMSMADCDACIAPLGGGYPQCDILATYAKLCGSMPDMEQCGTYKMICVNTPSFPLCASSNGSELPPSMIMYFHQGIREYILFKNWVPQSEAQYAGAWFAIFFIAIFYQGLSVVRSNCEGYWLLKAAQESKGKFKLFGSHESTISYALMLVTMTFNVGLFFAVVTGLAIGAFFFGRHRTLGGLAEGGTKLDGCAACQ
ncbi:hypothetical protein INT43_005301 [Umbelopsis isabellina]|uniref:Copper transport protein n=1 Tax=Mortierella isabellina TaxID=91625 RepID=A0A8H7PII4_MORIS|nr:hypothetical protein INT43_005301 [Umbelopsis isabellina]